VRSAWPPYRRAPELERAAAAPEPDRQGVAVSRLGLLFGFVQRRGGGVVFYV